MECQNTILRPPVCHTGGGPGEVDPYSPRMRGLHGRRGNLRNDFEHTNFQEYYAKQEVAQSDELALVVKDENEEICDQEMEPQNESILSSAENMK